MTERSQLLAVSDGDSSRTFTSILMFAAETLLVVAGLVRWMQHLRRLRG